MPSLVGMASLVSEILLLFACLQKWPNFPFRPIKSAQKIHASRECMPTKFGGHGLSGFGDFVPFCLPLKIPFGPQTVVHEIKKESAHFLKLKK